MCKLGIAYEWKGEDVYHAYLEYPQIAPSGYAVPCLFLKTQSISDFNNAETMLSKIGLAQDQLSRIGIVIVFCLEHDKLLKRSFVPNNDTKSIKIEYVP